MFSIGDFSRLAQVSPRLLLYCATHGMLQPESIDATGERCYRACQLARVHRIVVLRELGFGLQEIAQLVDQTSIEELRGMLLMRRCDIARLEVAEAEAAQMERLRLLEARVALLGDASSTGASDLVVRAEPARRVLCVRELLGSFARLRARLRCIADGVGRQLPAAALGPLVAVLHSHPFEHGPMDVQLGRIVQQGPSELRLADGTLLNLEELPAVSQMATCLHSGWSEHALGVRARLALFLEANDYRLAGPCREIALNMGAAQAKTEMQFPISSLRRRGSVPAVNWMDA